MSAEGQGMQLRTDPPSATARAVRAPVGDVCAEVLTVFEVFPEPVERWEDISWCIVARRKPVHWFAETFGDVGSRVQQDRGDIDDVFSSLMPRTTHPMDSPAPPGGWMATLKVYYEKPSRSFPQGRHVMTAGGQVLFAANQLPLPHLEIPLAMFGYRTVPKRLWPMGLVEHVLGLQSELNRAQSNLSEILRLYRGPKWIVPKEAKVDPDSITTSRMR